MSLFDRIMRGRRARDRQQQIDEAWEAHAETGPLRVREPAVSWWLWPWTSPEWRLPRACVMDLGDSGRIWHVGVRGKLD